MIISLTPELDRLVQEKLASGLFRTKSEVAQEWLRLLQKKKRLRQARLIEGHRKTGSSVIPQDKG